MRQKRRNFSCPHQTTSASSYRFQQSVLKRSKTTTMTGTRDSAYLKLGFGLEPMPCDNNYVIVFKSLQSFNRFPSHFHQRFGSFLVWTIGENVSESMCFQTKTNWCGQDLNLLVIWTVAQQQPGLVNRSFLSCCEPNCESEAKRKALHNKNFALSLPLIPRFKSNPEM